MPSPLPDLRIRTAFDQLLPGLIGKVEAMDGEFIADRIHPTSTFTPNRALRFHAFHISFAYKFPDNNLLRIEVRMKSDQENYKITKYSYHYGPDFLDPADHFFRIDFAYNADPLHVHIRGYKGHTEPHKCSPDIRNINAYEFIEIVEEFRRTRIQPFRRLP